MTCWGCGAGDDSDSAIASELCDTCKAEGILGERNKGRYAACPGHEFVPGDSGATLYNKEFPEGKALPPLPRCKHCGMWKVG